MDAVLYNTPSYLILILFFRLLVARLVLSRARSSPRARQRKGVGGARTLNGESACATLPSISKKPDAGCDMLGGTSGVFQTVCL